ncbi:flagellar biosynthesis anti-sigma factor FlgM [Exilibacterium tricleocarpae]|uniref:Negative regulator of flagellin synthesis n=1 Tax=Exilibacterium tricleocarpae TaxID=2591008 RepID=A0A545U3U4_9GAMM|nr:flagellar biosynthesis anti-sigma factor FlgM [Exilibacterium tricleocarpae]TQV84126.1 flagellar biosynthesis anti-sigma factor FlgM [Exilibacterium tricleocarpae]
MVINSNNGINPPGAEANRGKTGAAGNSTATAKSGAQATGGKDREDVVLSREAQALARLEARIQTTADVDTDKVDAIKAAIAGGRFEVNAERIAERLLQQDDLLG